MASLSEDDFSCPVCHEIVKNPVVLSVSVKSVFNSSGEPRKLRSVPSAGEDPQNMNLQLI